MWESNIAGCPIHSQLYREWVGNHKLPGNYPRTSRSAGCRVPHISILRCGKAISLGAPSIRSPIANGWETTNSQVITPHVKECREPHISILRCGKAILRLRTAVFVLHFSLVSQAFLFPVASPHILCNTDVASPQEWEM